MSPSGASVADLRDEHAALQAVTRECSPADWLRPTPARLWDVRDTISHLADTDEMAIDTIRGGPYALNGLAARAASTDDVTFPGVMRARRLPGEAVLDWWERTAAAECELLAALDPSSRVDWGIGMRASSFVTARLMETWAHGLDVHAALGAKPHDTDRLAAVAWLATRALPYAYTVAGREPPAVPLRVELILPSGASWTYGPEDAPARISGPAAQYCRVFVRRMRAADAWELEADGDAAIAALDVARAYL